MKTYIHIKRNVNQTGKYLELYDDKRKCCCRKNCLPLTEPHFTRICTKQNCQVKKMKGCNNEWKFKYIDHL